MRVLIVAGGTGGHLLPAINLAEEIKLRHLGDVLFVISTRRQDRDILEQKEMTFKTLPIIALTSKNPISILNFLLRLLVGTIESFFIILYYRPSVVIGFGGYISGPLLMWASLLRIKTLIHEQNAYPGKANRILAGFVDKIAISFPETKNYFKGFESKIIISGNPVRKGLVRKDKRPKDIYTILIMGGSQGSHALNKLVPEAVSLLEDNLKNKVQVIHIAGQKEKEDVLHFYRDKKIKARVFSFTMDMEVLYSESDFVIARSGATTVAELLFLQKPSILIPYPYGDGHQRLNAKVLEDMTGAILLEEKALKPEDLKEIIAKLMDWNVLMYMSDKIKPGIFKKDALDILIENIMPRPRDVRLDYNVFHFIGIGGAGMSGLAEAFHFNGYNVQGSDIKKTRVTERLEALGIKVNEGHSAENVNGADCIVYSSCIHEDNPEVKAALHKKIPVLRRMEALGMLMKDKDIVAVSGAHGKTTTSSLISYLSINAGLDPTVFIGADVKFLNGNARCSKSNLVITEADESDGSFLLLNPLYSVSTNIDREHLDYYSDMESVICAYKKFVENTRDNGCAFVCFDDENLKNIATTSSKKIIGYGLNSGARIRAEKIELLGLDGSRFDFVYDNKALGRVKISLIGMHNVLNSLAAIGVAMDLGIDFSHIQEIIGSFKGADRRFIVTCIDSDILVIDDYAHHPTEIRATLKAMEGSGRRIVAVFQPHRYSRTKYLNEEFGRCFDSADHVVITDIYAAHEKPINGVSAKNICDSAKKYGHKDVNFVTKEGIIGHLVDVVKPGDAVFILGAGDIGELPEKIVTALKNTAGQNGNSRK